MKKALFKLPFMVAAITILVVSVLMQVHPVSAAPVMADATAPPVAMAAQPGRNGYALLDAVGNVYAYGDSIYQGGFRSIANSTPPSGGGFAGLLTGTDRELAQKILSSGKVTGDSRYIGQIQNYANGNYSCQINPTILSVVYTIVAPTDIGGLSHSIDISSLNRYCTGVLTESGTGSYHYTSGGGHAVDIDRVDGVASTGSTTNDINLLNQIKVRLPQGSGIGQSNCRFNAGKTITVPTGVTQFTDSCNHNNIQVPIR